jgi:hypothetical protein
MHNVLSVYSQRLDTKRQKPAANGAGQSTPGERIQISAGAKRQAVIDKVVAGVVERITRFGPRDEIDRQIVDQLQSELQKRTALHPDKARQFIFNVIDGNREKSASALSADDASFLLKRFGELAREAVDRTMER